MTFTRRFWLTFIPLVIVACLLAGLAGMVLPEGLSFPVGMGLGFLALVLAERLTQ